MLADLGSAAVHLQAQTFERLVIGQIMETQGPAEGVDPLQHYLSVVADKTGSLIAASAQFGAMLSGAPHDQIDALAAFGEKIGITFQLVDDVIDIASQSEESGKTPGTDLKEGVPTLVTLNVMKSNRAEDRDLQELLKGPISDQIVVNQVLDQLRQHPALDQSREQVLGIANQARNLLGPLPVNDATGALFSLCDAVIDRSA
jgi:heptaprenyl diphosphate synthase